MQGIFLRNLCMKQKGGGCAAFCAVPLLRWTIRNGRRVCFGHAQRKNVFIILRMTHSCGVCHTHFHKKEWFYFMIPQKRTATQMCSSPFWCVFSKNYWLFSSDCTSGASTLASTAIDAGISVHNCSAVLDGDSANRASALASAAANTCVRNLVCHNKLSFFIPCRCNYEETYLGTATHAPRNLYPCLHSNKAGRKRQD